MKRRNVSIREDQHEWINERGLNLSEFLREQLDEEMGPSDDELAAAYRENADHAREVAEEWRYASVEANESLEADDADSSG